MIQQSTNGGGNGLGLKWQVTVIDWGGDQVVLLWHLNTGNTKCRRIKGQLLTATMTYCVRVCASVVCVWRVCVMCLCVCDMCVCVMCVCVCVCVCVNWACGQGDWELNGTHSLMRCPMNLVLHSNWLWDMNNKICCCCCSSYWLISSK